MMEKMPKATQVLSPIDGSWKYKLTGIPIAVNIIISKIKFFIKKIFLCKKNQGLENTPAPKKQACEWKEF